MIKRSYSTSSSREWSSGMVFRCNWPFLIIQLIFFFVFAPKIQRVKRVNINKFNFDRDGHAGKQRAEGGLHDICEKSSPPVSRQGWTPAYPASSRSRLLLCLSCKFSIPPTLHQISPLFSCFSFFHQTSCGWVPNLCFSSVWRFHPLSYEEYPRTKKSNHSTMITITRKTFGIDYDWL